MQMSNHQKLLAKMKVPPETTDKFDKDYTIDAKDQIDSFRALREILEISTLDLKVMQFKLQQEGHTIGKKGYRYEHPNDFARGFVKFIYENLEKPQIFASETYIHNCFS